MKKSTLALAIMALISSGAVSAAVKGDSSDIYGVETGVSDHGSFNTGNSGIKLNNTGKFIDLADGPLKGSNTAIAARGNGTILKPADMGMPALPINVAQVWKDTASVSDGSNDANFAINSVRQITTLAIAPQFGGLVIGQVADASGAPLAVGNGVYFGEWAPRAAGTPPLNSTDLNMASADRTVWYVGDNAVTSMPTAIDATYGVIGISQTGTDASGNTLPGGLPDNLNLYTGKLQVSYGGPNAITGTIDRGSSSINFAGTTINSNGTFGNGTTIEGRFYNGAEALAGMYTNGAVPDVAFGGSKIDGTITP